MPATFTTVTETLATCARATDIALTPTRSFDVAATCVVSSASLVVEVTTRDA